MLKEADAEVFGMLVMKMTTGADGRVRSAEFTGDRHTFRSDASGSV